MTASSQNPGPTNTDKKPEAGAPEKLETPAAAVKPTGSPVTAGTSKAAEEADNSPATGPGNHANIAGATQDPKNPDVVVPGAVLTEDSRTDRAPDQAGSLPNAGTPKVGSEPGTEADVEFEKALNEPDVVPTPTDDDLDKKDIEEIGATLAKAHKKFDEEFAPVRIAMNNIAVMVLDVVGKDTKDSFNVWGYGGKNITLGDLRTIARDWRKSGQGDE